MTLCENGNSGASGCLCRSQLLASAGCMREATSCARVKVVNNFAFRDSNVAPAADPIMAAAFGECHWGLGHSMKIQNLTRTPKAKGSKKGSVLNVCMFVKINNKPSH